METLNKIVRTHKEYAELIKKGLIMSFYPEGVHVGSRFFISIPGQLHEKDRDSADYPFEIYKIYDGIRLFALSKNSMLAEAEVYEELREEAKWLEAETLEIWG